MFHGAIQKVKVARFSDHSVAVVVHCEP